MAALSNTDYGRGTTVSLSSAEFADRLSGSLETAYAALDTLHRGNEIGAAADQGAINTIRKVLQDLGQLAGEQRKAASDEALQSADEKAKAAEEKGAPRTGSGPAGSGTVKA